MRFLPPLLALCVAGCTGGPINPPNPPNLCNPNAANRGVSKAEAPAPPPAASTASNPCDATPPPPALPTGSEGPSCEGGACDASAWDDIPVTGHSSPDGADGFRFTKPVYAKPDCAKPKADPAPSCSTAATTSPADREWLPWAMSVALLIALVLTVRSDAKKRVT